MLGLNQAAPKAQTTHFPLKSIQDMFYTGSVLLLKAGTSVCLTHHYTKYPYSDIYKFQKISDFFLLMCSNYHTLL